MKDDKELKKIFGTIFYHMFDMGYTVILDTLKDNTQTFFVPNKGLDKFYFVLRTHYDMDNELDAVFVDAVPHPIHEEVFFYTLYANPLRVKIPVVYDTMDEQFALNFDTNILQKFLKNLSRNRKLLYYLFNCDAEDPEKIASVFKRNKFYRNN